MSNQGWPKWDTLSIKYLENRIVNVKNLQSDSWLVTNKTEFDIVLIDVTHNLNSKRTARIVLTG